MSFVYLIYTVASDILLGFLNDNILIKSTEK
jgi:hypothetical protein